jgi:hypothetical protein
VAAVFTGEIRVEIIEISLHHPPHRSTFSRR